MKNVQQYLIVLLALMAWRAHAAVLPEDRADLLYHSYDGGGVTVDGPSVLVRKSIADKVSVWGNYYVDMISSASLDVVTQGSPYTEERTETGGGIDYLRDRTSMSLSYSQSSESDYQATTIGFGVSQDFFGDLSTLSLGYSQGNDTVMQNGTPDFEEDAHHQRFNIGWSQILTKNWIMAFNAETVLDEGFLNNPYRSVRYLDTSGAPLLQKELYPTTRSSDAFAIRSMYYLPYRAAIRAEARYFSDSWDIQSSNIELRYIHPYGNRWIWEAKIRSYSQTQASFYSDLFPFVDAQNFLARDKEMSEYSNTSFGVGATYELRYQWLAFFEKATANLYWDHFSFDYANYRENLPENTQEYGAGNEPLYSFDANVIRFFVSAWY